MQERWQGTDGVAGLRCVARRRQELWPKGWKITNITVEDKSSCKATNESRRGSVFHGLSCLTGTVQISKVFLEAGTFPTVAAAFARLRKGSRHTPFTQVAFDDIPSLLNVHWRGQHKDRSLTKPCLRKHFLFFDPLLHDNSRTH